MKRFRFQLDPYLGLLRRELEAAESKAAELQSQREASRNKSHELLRERQTALEGLATNGVIEGDRLRGLDAWRNTLKDNAAAARRHAEKLEGPIQRALAHVTEVKRRVELLDRLRERRAAAHLRLEDREIEQTAAELHLAARQRRLS